MLTDIRGRDENLCEGDRVIRKEVKLKVFVGLRVRIDNSSYIDDEANGLFLLAKVILKDKREPTNFAM